jgi:hypothetical protein
MLITPLGFLKSKVYNDILWTIEEFKHNIYLETGRIPVAMLEK